MKRWIGLLFAVMVLINATSTLVFAAVTVDLPLDTGVVIDEDGDSVSDIFVSSGSVTGDPVSPGTTFYIRIMEQETVDFGHGDVKVSRLLDDDDFSFKMERDRGSRYLDSVKYVDRNIDGAGRAPYIQVKLKKNSLLDEEKLSFDVYFKAKRSSAGNWSSGDRARIRFSLWVQNPRTDDDYIDVGDGMVYEPRSNDDNYITWGANEDIASLEFEGDSDADKFYAKLSTKAVRWVYEDYGDPVDAELFFRDFTGNPQIPSTSRATLTLYNPFDSDDYDRWYNDYVDPDDCYIYLAGRNGELSDITSYFTYVSGDDTEAGLPGWRAKVRTLGTYVISDRELPLDNWVYDEDEAHAPKDDVFVPAPGSTNTTKPTRPTSPVKPAPTGSKDFVALASVLGAASLAVVALCKKRK